MPVITRNYLTFESNRNGKLILAGDPKQLPPVVKSGVAVEHGLGVSLLERLMARAAYARDPETGAFDPRLITKLVRHYRSYPEIIQTSNELFYDGELIPSADPEKLFDVKQLNWLPEENYPLVFINVRSETKRGGGTSVWNPLQVEIVKSLVRSLKENFADEEIGVLAAYKLQATKIEEALTSLSPEEPLRVKVATTERFQGQERQVMVLSTVR